MQIGKTKKEVGDAFIRFMEMEFGVSFVDVTPQTALVHEHFCYLCERTSSCYEGCTMPRDRFIICDPCWRDKSTLKDKIDAAKKRGWVPTVAERADANQTLGNDPKS